MEKIFFKKMKKKDTIVIIGNGPSMKKEYIDIIKDSNIDSLGMNSIYRYLNRIHWYPTYYTCFDSRVAGSHKKEFIKMMEDDNINIKKFVFYKENFGDYSNNKLILKDSPPKFNKQSYNLVTTGSCSVRFAIEMGYKNVILTGIDANYKDKVADRDLVPGTRATFKLKETPENNPNYFFSDYQLKGDIYNIPNKNYHVASWMELLSTIRKFNINLIQTSDIFELPNVRNVEFKKIMKEVI